MENSTIASAPKPKFLAYYEKYMFAVGILGQLLYFIQGIKIFTTHSAHDVSLMGFSLGFISVASWLMYGILIKNKALIAANICAVIGALFVITGVLMYSTG